MKKKKGNTISITKTRCEKFKSKIQEITVNGKTIPIKDINFVNNGKSLKLIIRATNVYYEKPTI